MIEFGGSVFYIDLDALDKTLVPTNTNKQNDKIENRVVKSYYDEDGKLTSKEEIVEILPRQKEIDGPKYDVIKGLIDVILDSMEDDEDSSDFTLGVDRVLSKKPLWYQVAFNTLYFYGILKEKE